MPRVMTTLKLASFSLFALVGCASLEASTTDNTNTSEATQDVTATKTCTATTDYNNDALNCGTCGNACASGLCYSGVCADSRAGHMFVIGNSFRKSNPSWDRMLANALFLREKTTALNVLVYRGTNGNDFNTGELNAISRGATLMHRTFTKTVITNSAAVQTSLPTADVLVIEAQPQLSDAALAGLADEWSLPIDDFTRNGGTVIVLDAPSTANHGTAQVLGALMPLRQVAVGTIASVSAYADDATARVPLTFALAESVGYAPSTFVDGAMTDSGAVVVSHRTVQ
jgi:hypothetical protein